jgi:hypothetical protein
VSKPLVARTLTVMAGYAPPQPKFIRCDMDTWITLRNDSATPKALIQGVRHDDGHERYLLFRWALHSSERQLVNVRDSLESANQILKYDVPRSQDICHGPPNGVTDSVAKGRLTRQCLTATSSECGPLVGDAGATTQVCSRDLGDHGFVESGRPTTRSLCRSSTESCVFAGDQHRLRVHGCGPEPVARSLAIVRVR